MGALLIFIGILCFVFVIGYGIGYYDGMKDAP